MNRQARFTDRQGFTLIELLVVITLILLVSAVTLPTVISAYTHRQVCEAARILQAGLVGARDIAINNNAPAGIRLLPDPVFNGIDPSDEHVSIPNDPGVEPLHPHPTRAGLLGGQSGHP